MFAIGIDVGGTFTDLVAIDVAELPPLLDAAAEPGEFSAGRNTEPTLVRQGYGDVDAVFACAETVVELDLSVGRHSGVPLETRGAIGRHDASRDILELHGAAKVPHRNQELISRMLGLAPSSVQVFEGHTGGGFGIRGEIYPEDILVCVAARAFGRPVKWIEDRREHLIAANHSRQQLHKIRAAVDQKLDGVAWRTRPSWYIVGANDHTVNPDLERAAAQRMGAKTYEFETSHVPMVSRPDLVLDVVRTAANAVQESLAAV